MSIFQSIECLVNEEPNKHEGFSDFSISYFGVRKRCVNENMVYLLVNKDGDWIRTVGNNGLHSEGKLLFMNIKQLAFAIRSYWQSELLSVGMKVLLKLEGLYKSKSNDSAFHQSTSLVHIFEVSKFLSDCQCLKLASPDKKKLQGFLGIFARYFDLVFPLDWRRSVSEDIVSLRVTDLSLNLLDEIILQNVSNNGNISYRTIGRVMMVCLCSSKSVTLNGMIIKGLQWAPKWKSVAEIWNSDVRHKAIFPMLKSALKDTFWSDLRCAGCISPHSFVYLLDRVFLVESCFHEILYTKRSSFAGWFIHQDSTKRPELPDAFVRFEVTSYLEILEEILSNKEDTESWIRRSNMEVSSYYLLLVLELVMMFTLACLQVPDCFKNLSNLLTGSNNIASLLPEKFVGHLLSQKKGENLQLCPQMVAKAFMSIEDPLLLVSSGKPDPKFNAPDAIFVDLEKSKEEIASALFSRKAVVCCQVSSDDDECETILEAPSSNTSSNANEHVNSKFNAPHHISVDLEKPEEIISKLLSRKAFQRNHYCETNFEAPSSSNTSSNANVHVNPMAEYKEKEQVLGDSKKLLFSFLEQLQPSSAIEEVKEVISSFLFDTSEDEAKSEPEFKNPHVKGGKKKAVQAMAKSGAGEEQAKRLMDDAFVEDVCKKFLKEGSSSKTSGADEAAKSTKGKGKSKNKKGKKKKN